ncbi:hypothetical protein Poli38472_000701 [Pythium oligandrum]|uniref:Crinkler effector protein N-terminal domain-containing protein n=1 Tax=Pythium oligandrum TaxID=41045 RepID=A0A8K1FH49_PYTOL|nr:hypothetical protein Poli38472_000701 [Pythium oligandrum]|eukprot:TMW60659.1 hypothetical protein Poli38472_000701 [Pythium oligandrum]
MSSRKDYSPRDLTYVIVGDGRIYGVDIHPQKRVRHLLGMIKEENKETIKCDAKDLTLYLAKKDNWLKTSDPDVKKLQQGDVPNGIVEIMKKAENEMTPAYRIGNTAFNFPDEDTAQEDEIHVLVVVPGQSIQRSSVQEPHSIRKRRWDEMNEILARNKKAKLGADGTTSTAFSYVSYNDLANLVRASSYEQPPKPIDDSYIDVLYEYLLIATKAFGEVVTGKEAKRLHFIAPVLA